MSYQQHESTPDTEQKRTPAASNAVAVLVIVVIAILVALTLIAIVGGLFFGSYFTISPS
jgi:hypothetical protein